MEGSRVVVSMGKQTAGSRVVRRDTYRARRAFTRAVGSAHNERRREDNLDDALSTVAAMRGTLAELLSRGTGGPFTFVCADAMRAGLTEILSSNIAGPAATNS